MEQFKRAKVVMLTTKDKHSGIILSNKTPHLYNRIGRYNELFGNDGSVSFQHLYITSDDKIKEGDYGIGFAQGIQGKGRGHYLFKHNGNSASKLNALCRNSKKIIATTDKSLAIQCIRKDNTLTDNYSNLLPQLSPQFIQKYIEEYNKGNIITDVLVEYETIQTTKKEDYKYEDGKGNLNYINRIKINHKDNTITIKKLKDSWNKEEVIELLKLLERNIEDNMDSDDDGNAYNNINLDNWIKENL